MTTCERSQATGWLLTESEPSMSSVGASLVRTYPTQAIASASRVNGRDCGPKSPDWLAIYDPASSSWRTSQHCLVEGLAEFSETFPTSGMTRNGRCFRLADLAPHTHESACFLWHTPTTNECKPAGQKEMAMMLRHMAGHSVPNTYIRLRSQLAARSGRLLPANPPWIEWLMGFPIGWTDCSPSETPLTPASLS